MGSSAWKDGGFAGPIKVSFAPIEGRLTQLQGRLERRARSSPDHWKRFNITISYWESEFLNVNLKGVLHG